MTIPLSKAQSLSLQLRLPNQSASARPPPSRKLLSRTKLKWISNDSDDSSLKPEQKQLEADLTNAIKAEGQYTPRLHRWKTDEEQIMTDINLDAEFEEMERNKQLSEARRSSAKLAPLPE